MVLQLRGFTAEPGYVCAAPLLQVSRVIMDQPQQPLVQHLIHTGLSRCPHSPAWLKELTDSTCLGHQGSTIPSKKSLYGVKYGLEQTCKLAVENHSKLTEK